MSTTTDAPAVLPVPADRVAQWARTCEALARQIGGGAGAELRVLAGGMRATIERPQSAAARATVYED